MFRERTVGTPRGVMRALDSEIPAAYARALHNFVLDRRPERVLEIGMACGISSVAIAAALEESGQGALTSIDPFQSATWESAGLETLVRCGLEHRHELIEDFDYLAMPRLVQSRSKFDFIYVDGSHTFDSTVLDLAYADKLLEVGGVVALNDCGFAAVDKSIRWLISHRNYGELDVGLPAQIGTPAYDAPSRVVAYLEPMIAVGIRLFPAAIEKLCRSGCARGLVAIFADRYLEKLDQFEPSWDYFARF